MALGNPDLPLLASSFILHADAVVDSEKENT